MLNNIANAVADEVPYVKELADQANEAANLSQVICLGGGVCGSQVSYTTGVAQELGMEAMPVVYKYTSKTGEKIGHTATMVRSGGAWWIVDASDRTAMTLNEFFIVHEKLEDLFWYSKKTSEWVAMH